MLRITSTDINMNSKNNYPLLNHKDESNITVNKQG
jgi:hypothetical protein